MEDASTGQSADQAARLMRLTHSRKPQIIEHIITNAPSAVLEEYQRMIDAKRAGLPRKRKREDEEEGDVTGRAHGRSGQRRRTVDVHEYLRSPSAAVIMDCCRRFIERTSNSALANWICAVCSRERDHLGPDKPPANIRLANMPNAHKLYPSQPHAEHDIYHGMLLDPAGLRPKIGGAPDGSSNQRAMRGNVCSYDLDMNGVADMVEGDLLPRPLSILPSTLSVTIIGPGPLPEGWLHSTFRNDPKYFGALELSEERLSSIPDDDVPAEVLACITRDDDEGIGEEEHGGYAPQDEEGGGDVHEGDQDQAPDLTVDAGLTFEAEVIPFDIAGSVDSDLRRVPVSDVAAWGISNLWEQGQEGGYVVRHGSRFVSDFGPGGKRRRREMPVVGNHAEEHNFFEKAFPYLFPYGRGGIESTRRVPLDFREEVQWCMRHHTRRFARSETFCFVVFGILQRREALGSARLQMQRKTFERDALTIMSITDDKLEQAIDEEARGVAISDPSICLLRSYVHATAARVTGTDTARVRLRSQIWSTSLTFGPPSLWITINPSDIHDPIAQIFAGEDIDMDSFLATSGPDKHERAVTIAKDPYAAAKYFHFVIRLVLEVLLGVHVTPFKTTSQEGIFGRVSAYFGTVESQGRGTLHLHMLVYLENTPTSSQLQLMLKDPEYRARAVEFIRTCIRAYLPGLEDGESVKSIERNAEVPYSRPIHPDVANYAERVQMLETKVARMQQVHTCHRRRCLVLNKKGVLECKRGAPFDRNEEDFVLEDGRWGPKRLFPYINAWNPAIAITLKCNNDIKLLTNGAETKSIAFYCTSYAGKKQQKTHSQSALLAKGYAYHQTTTDYLDSMRDRNRLLLNRLVQTVNREQELAAPMVMSYLMGWGDVYRSHHYTAIYWTTFTRMLLRTYPDIQTR
ncbi:uncharacterized protein SCHCODRAFT_01171736 [Schizophyllum commune H4-8]|nr:uncharacterized protein SCHCODRAFT_01171736 [Schizophyllum commune H4-8]KAI5892666.1 hypothetical protein SCHCODRAFT_01171736 [Schizophyllum commune H4-8]